MKKLPLQLSNQDEVGRGACQRGGASDTGCIRDTDQESFPHLQLILGLQLDLLRCHHVTLIHQIHPVEVLRDMITSNEQQIDELVLVSSEWWLSPILLAQCRLKRTSANAAGHSKKTSDRALNQLPDSYQLQCKAYWTSRHINIIKIKDY